MRLANKVAIVTGGGTSVSGGADCESLRAGRAQKCRDHGSAEGGVSAGRPKAIRHRGACLGASGKRDDEPDVRRSGGDPRSRTFGRLDILEQRR